LEEELEVAQNFLKRTTTSIAKPIPHVIVISNLEEEVEIRSQFVVEEISQLVSTSRPVEEGELQQPIVEEQPRLILVPRPVEGKELQQLLSNGEAFLQELFEEGHVSNIIPWCLRLGTRTMMK